MDVNVLSVIAAVATMFVLPALSYLVIRRDQKIDSAEAKLHTLEVGQAKLEVLATMAKDHVTRGEFEAAMLSVNRGLEDIKERLDREA